MKKFAAKSPVVFEIVLIILAFVLAFAFGVAGQMAGFALWNVANHFLTKGEFNPLTQEILILVLLAAEAVYAFVLVSKGKTVEKQ